MSIKIIISKNVKKLFPFYEPFEFNFTYQTIENKKEREKQRLRETIAYYCEQNARINEALNYCGHLIRKNQSTNHYFEYKNLQNLVFRNTKIIGDLDKQLKKLCNF